MSKDEQWSKFGLVILGIGVLWLGQFLILTRMHIPWPSIITHAPNGFFRNLNCPAVLRTNSTGIIRATIANSSDQSRSYTIQVIGHNYTGRIGSAPLSVPGHSTSTAEVEITFSSSGSRRLRVEGIGPGDPKYAKTGGGNSLPIYSNSYGQGCLVYVVDPPFPLLPAHPLNIFISVILIISGAVILLRSLWLENRST